MSILSLVWMMSCSTPPLEHHESLKIKDKPYDCVCTLGEKTEPECGEDDYCTYAETFTCKCKEAVKVAYESLEYKYNRWR